MDEMQRPAVEGFPVVFQALAEQGIEAVGAPFYNYRRINMAETLDVEAGVAVARPGSATDRVSFATLPGGRFVTLRWHGHPDHQAPGLIGAGHRRSIISFSTPRRIAWPVSAPPSFQNQPSACMRSAAFTNRSHTATTSASP